MSKKVKKKSKLEAGRIIVDGELYSRKVEMPEDLIDESKIESMSLSEINDVQKRLYQQISKIAKKQQSQFEKLVKNGSLDSYWKSLAEEQNRLSDNPVTEKSFSLRVPLDVELCIKIDSDGFIPEDAAEGFGKLTMGYVIQDIIIHPNGVVNDKQAAAIASNLKEKFVGDVCEGGIKKAIPGIKEIKEEFKQLFDNQVKEWKSLSKSIADSVEQIGKDGDDPWRKDIDLDSFDSYVTIMEEEEKKKKDKKKPPKKKSKKKPASA